MTRIACCQYQIEKLSHWEQYTNKIETIIQEAKLKKAEIILFPEYAGMEIACQFFKTDQELFNALQSLIPNYIQLYQQLAKQYQIYIQPGSIIEANSLGTFNNRAYFFSPTGLYGFQDKLKLTEFEKKLQVLQPGKHQTLFETPFGKIGIAICYDSEFSQIIRNLTKAGATLILVPSYTPTIQGFNRVFISSRARAIENQCYVAVSFVVNKFNLSAEEEMTYGQAALFSPADQGFPEEGIIALGTFNQTEIVTGDFHPDQISFIRENGQVHNFLDTEDDEYSVQVSHIG